MGVNSTDIFHDQSESILCGIESEHVWGVLLHGVRRIGISGSDGRGGVSWKYREVLERRKKVILLQPPGQPARANLLRLRSHPLLYLVRACFGLPRQIGCIQGKQQVLVVLTGL
jgi:hypothetical protein